jgi:hypothetical protein
MKTQKSYSEVIRRMGHGDSYTVIFPENFELEYKNFQGELIKFTCSRMHAWYWDDDDHRCLDKYFYEVGGTGWVSKWWHLTEESRKKVQDFLENNYTTDYPIF